MKRSFLIGILLMVFAAGLFAQQATERNCGTGELPQQYEDWVQTLTPPKPGKFGQSTTQSVFYIPVVVHVIHNNETLNSVSATSGGNLNTAQILSQITTLNNDFGGTNADTTLIPAVFKALMGRFNMVFCLAVVNPTGGIMPEPGIDRINRVNKSWTAPPYSMSYIDATIKPNSIWDPNRYLNIWVCRISGSTLGYATFPNPGTSGVGGLGAPYGSATTDGVVISNIYFGNTGTAAGGSFNKGRTATHEIGHWMGLRHIWGDANCGTDYCNDTPPAQTSNFGCKTHPFRLGTCAGNTTGEMYMNYMDYSDDWCLTMFSNDQKKRAQLIMTGSPMRAALITSTVCNLPNIGNDIGISSVAQPGYMQNVNCSSNFINPVVNLTNYGSTTLTSALLSYNINGANTQTLTWTGNLNPGASTTVALSQISNIPIGNHTFSVNISSPNGGTDNNLINNNSLQQFAIVSSVNLTVNSATICAGLTASLTANGAANYTWSTGSNNSGISVNPTATTVYTVTTGSGSCMFSKTAAVTVFTTVLNVTTSGYSITCSTCSDGTVNTTVSGGKAPYTYAWSPLSASTKTVDSLAIGCYTVTVTDLYGCTGSAEYCVTYDVGLREANSKSETVNIIPNPNQGLFTLQFGDAKSRNIEIVDLLGRTVKSITSISDSAAIDISEFSSGIYYVRVTSEKGLSILKAVKNQ